jgi:hypothetical protein
MGGLPIEIRSRIADVRPTLRSSEPHSFGWPLLPNDSSIFESEARYRHRTVWRNASGLYKYSNTVSNIISRYLSNGKNKQFQIKKVKSSRIIE